MLKEYLSSDSIEPCRFFYGDWELVIRFDKRKDQFCLVDVLELAPPDDTPPNGPGGTARRPGRPTRRASTTQCLLQALDLPVAIAAVPRGDVEETNAGPSRAQEQAVSARSIVSRALAEWHIVDGQHREIGGP
jgi:hypothetical protein